MDDELTDKYLEGDELIDRRICAALRGRRSQAKLVPVCAARAANKGVQPLLDAVVAYLPSPLDIPPINGTHPETDDERHARLRDERALLAPSSSRS